MSKTKTIALPALVALDPRLPTKLEELGDVGLPAETAALVILGTGGSPRRARKAVRYGLSDLFADAYLAAKAELDSHAAAVAHCGALYEEYIAKPRAAARAAA